MRLLRSWGAMAFGPDGFSLVGSAQPTQRFAQSAQRLAWRRWPACCLHGATPEGKGADCRSTELLGLAPSGGTPPGLFPVPCLLAVPVRSAASPDWQRHSGAAWRMRPSIRYWIHIETSKASQVRKTGSSNGCNSACSDQAPNHPPSIQIQSPAAAPGSQPRLAVPIGALRGLAGPLVCFAVANMGGPILSRSTGAQSWQGFYAAAYLLYRQIRKAWPCRLAPEPAQRHHKSRTRLIVRPLMCLR